MARGETHVTSSANDSESRIELSGWKERQPSQWKEFPSEESTLEERIQEVEAGLLLKSYSFKRSKSVSSAVVFPSVVDNGF